MRESVCTKQKTRSSELLNVAEHHNLFALDRLAAAAKRTMIDVRGCGWEWSSLDTVKNRLNTTQLFATDCDGST